jgi:hypothetical protein
MLGDFENGDWIYRRNKNIRGTKSEFGWTADDGLQVIAPEIQLLYKSRSPRDKDTQDFTNCLAVFGKDQKEKLRKMLILDSGESHPWLGALTFSAAGPKS